MRRALVVTTCVACAITGASVADTTVHLGDNSLAGGQMNSYSFNLEGSLQDFAIAFDYVDGGSLAWASDMILQIIDPNGVNRFWGGFNVNPAGATSVSPWSFDGSASSTSGYYADVSNPGAAGMGGSGSWTFNVWNGWAGAPTPSGYNNVTVQLVGVEVAPFPIESVDPSYTGTPLLDSEGVIDDANLLSEFGVPRTGIAADGVTRIILRQEVAGPGTVLFSLADENGGTEGVGSLASVLEGGGATQLSAPAVQLLDGRFMAFAVLTSPGDFVRDSGDISLATRPVVITAQFTPPVGPTSTASKVITLHRPPVLLLHGLWSSGDTWTWPLQLDRRFEVTAFDYGSTNAESFEENRFVVRLAIIQVLEEARSRGIAATQADVIAHSMGGLLCRLFVADRWEDVQYKRIRNFNAGDIHKLITLDTPHMGSPLAEFLIADDGGPNFLGTAITKAKLFCVDCGAVADLRPSRFSVVSMPEAQVPVHAIAGKGGSDLIERTLVELAPPPARALVRLLEFAGVIEDIFPPAYQHDLIVGRISQEGGLDAEQTTVVGLELVPPSLGLHITVTKEFVPSNVVEDLLNASVDSPLFAQSLPAVSGGLAGDGGGNLPSELPIGLTIVTPGDGELLSAGSAVEVVVEALAGYTPESVVIVGPESAVFVSQAPFSALVDLPAALLGEATLWAIGLDANGSRFAAQPVTISVGTTATLQAISMAPTTAYLSGQPNTIQLSVTGAFSDGILRDASSVASGTEYLSDDTSVATVDRTGRVTAVGVGVTQVRAKNGPLESVSSVHVIALPTIGDINGDDDVNATDLAILLGAWGRTGAADLDSDGVVGASDIAILLGSWSE